MKSALPLVAIALLAAFGALYLGLAGGHSEAARRRIEPASAERIGRISAGESVDLREYVRPDGLTIVEFSAEWCGACRRLAPRLEEIVRSRDDAVLRVVDIGDWQSPVAAQYGVRAVPHLVLFDRGEVVASGTAAVLAQLRE